MNKKVSKYNLVLMTKTNKGIEKMDKIKLNKNKVSFSQCKKMIKELNNNANINNIPIKLDIQKSLIQDNNVIKYKLLVFNLNKGTNKTKGTYTLKELHNHLFKHFTKNK